MITQVEASPDFAVELDITAIDYGWLYGRKDSNEQWKKICKCDGGTLKYAHKLADEGRLHVNFDGIHKETS